MMIIITISINTTSHNSTTTIAVIVFFHSSGMSPAWWEATKSKLSKSGEHMNFGAVEVTHT